MSGTVGSKSVKKVRVSGTAAPPKMTAVFHLQGGTLVAKVKDGHTVNGVLKGTFKLSGTGRYASASGGGKLSASLTTFVFKFNG